MADAILTPCQSHAIRCADALMEAAGLPTYTELLAMLDATTRPLPAAGHIALGYTGDDFAEPGFMVAGMLEQTR